MKTERVFESKKARSEKSIGRRGFLRLTAGTTVLAWPGRMYAGRRAVLRRDGGRCAGRRA